MIRYESRRAGTNFIFLVFDLLQAHRAIASLMEYWHQYPGRRTNLETMQQETSACVDEG